MEHQMITQRFYQLLILVLLLSSVSGCKDLQPVLDKVKPLLEQHSGSSSNPSSAISIANMIDAIKQALAQGVGDSVNLLSSAQGFTLSDVYHIPLPQQLNKSADLLRKLGQGKYVDEFESRLNSAAEHAVAKAVPVFTSAIREMTVDDALNIMKGKDNAATLYFRSKTETVLRGKFLPIIKSATDQTGLTSSYKSLNKKVSSVAPFYSSKLVDIDEYVLGNAMDALFDRVAIEEKMIRENPAKRGTDLMKSVYGHFAK